MKNNFPNSVAEINLAAASRNLSSIKEKAASEKVLAVVKCNAYSHGAVHLTKHIEKEVDFLAVANVDEGIELRMGGITKPILVFGVPTYETAAVYLTHNLTATISHTTQFSILMDGTSYHLNFDTGMGRLGFLPEQAGEVRQLAVANQRLICSGIYSHYATADDPGSDFVITQNDRFKQILPYFSEVPLIHMSNTGAASNYGQIDHFGMIRTGLGMLGYNSGETRHKWLEPVMSWRTNLAQIRAIKKGMAVSYSSTWRSPEDGFLGTLPVGYGDGIPRSLSNKLKVLINGNLYSQVGNVTMDMMMIYLGKEKLSAGADVLMLGSEGWNAHDWADHAGTNVHEILTNLTSRVDNRYVIK